MLIDWADILAAEGRWRWAVTLAVFCLVAAWETLAPLRNPSVSTARRWTGHLALYFFSGWFLSLVVPFSAVAAAVASRESPYGLLNRTAVPLWLAWPVAILALDFIRYGQHWLLHRVPFLWRVHAVHHADPDYDLTTGLRFHPVEAFFTLSTQCAAIAILAPPPLAVFAGELLFILQVHLVHGNVAFPEAVDRVLRRLLVTPNVHAIHHAVAVEDQNSNFGGVFSVWDRVFQTYRTRPTLYRAHAPMGLEGFEGERGILWSTLFFLPFRRQGAARYSSISARSRPAASSQPPPVRGS